MKTITCKMMGGMCDAPLSANSYDEMMTVGMEHLEKAHPEMAADVKAMPKDDPKMLAWEVDFKKTWAETAEV
jgi:predicted small metal-binding protein